MDRLENNSLIVNLTQEQINKEIEIGKKLKKIAEFKQFLKDTDDQAIKYAEGLINEENYAQIKAKRQEWRDKIDELEKEI